MLMLQRISTATTKVSQAPKVMFSRLENKISAAVESRESMLLLLLGAEMLQCAGMELVV